MDEKPGKRRRPFEILTTEVELPAPLSALEIEIHYEEAQPIQVSIFDFLEIADEDIASGE